MWPLPSGFGVPHWPVSFDGLGLAWMLIVPLVLLAGALWLVPLCWRRAVGNGDPRRRRPPKIVLATRRARRHLRSIV